MRPVHGYLVILSLTVLSCVSTGKFKSVQLEAAKNDSLYTWSQRTLKTSQEENNMLEKQKISLRDKFNDLELQLTASQENNTQMRRQLQTLSALSSTQAESIKKSLDNMGARDAYVWGLQSALAHRDSVNMVVLMNLKANLGGLDVQDVSIKIEKGVVYVDLSDQLLFENDSNSYTVTDRAKTVLSRLARALNDQPDIDLIVEGHTDSLSYPGEILLDNWDRSVKRATTLVRLLQNEYKILPIRMTAAGRSEYNTIAPNDTPEARAANRRTRIIILPQLEQLLKALERGEGQGRPTGPATVSGS